MKKWSSDEVRELRWKLGWSQSEFARQLGCLQKLIAEWENGLNEPSSVQHEMLMRLQGESDIYTGRIRCESQADAFLEEQKSSQITHTEVAFRLEKS
jgi:transcriptional regulator with XRE-family HTH domain